jgi:hypothetical protein
MSTLRPNRVSVRQFTRHEGKLVSEISSTHGFGRVYDDACDEGLTVVDELGFDALFVVDRTVANAEGEITSWELKLLHYDNKNYLGFPNRMVLFND